MERRGITLRPVDGSSYSMSGNTLFLCTAPTASTSVYYCYLSEQTDMPPCGFLFSTTSFSTVFAQFFAFYFYTILCILSLHNSLHSFLAQFFAFFPCIILCILSLHNSLHSFYAQFFAFFPCTILCILSLHNSYHIHIHIHNTLPAILTL